MDIRYIDNAMSAEILAGLRNTIGWGSTSLAKAEKAIQGTLFSVVAFDDNIAVGMGRVIGDGALIWYIQDVIVLPEYQGKRIGTVIMEKLIEYARANGVPGEKASIGLMAAKGKDAFYQRLGFRIRPNDREGSGMMMSIDT